MSASSDRTLRAGVVGLGMMGRHHVRVLRELEGVDLVAVADPGGDPHGVSGDLPVLGSVAELIKTGVDYVVVATPTGLHEAVGVTENEVKRLNWIDIETDEEKEEAKKAAAAKAREDAKKHSSDIPNS